MIAKPRLREQPASLSCTSSTLILVLADAYVTGHIVMAAFSFSIGISVVIWRLRAPRSGIDWPIAALSFLAAAASTTAALLAAYPSIGWARAYLLVMGWLYVASAYSFVRQHGHAVFTDRELTRAERMLAVYAAFTLVLSIANYAGVLGSEVRTSTVFGIRASMQALSWPVFVVLAMVPLAHPFLAYPLLARPGREARHRRVVLVMVLCAPLIALHDLGVGAGLPSVPVGGYFVVGISLFSVLLLTERFRSTESTIGRWRVERRLGAGGMAEVWLATRRGPGALEHVVRRVALKRLRREHVGDPALVSMFVNEANVIARLSHPNIVQLYEVGEERRELYLAMELVDGPPLSKILRWLGSCGAVATTEVVAEVAVQLCDALAYAHGLEDEAGKPLEIVHRDVSPQNILVTSSGFVKLTDFGIARSTDRLSRTATGVLRGKIHYLAPEQIRGEPYDHRVDIYALGIVMFELATGARPFSGESEAALLYNILGSRVQSRDKLDELPEALRTAILRMLLPDPSHRFFSALEVREALMPFRSESRARAQLAELAREAAMHDEDSETTGLGA